MGWRPASPYGEAALQSWREVEVELGPAGKEKDLKRAGKLLRAAGAAPARSGPSSTARWAPHR